MDLVCKILGVIMLVGAILLAVYKTVPDARATSALSHYQATRGHVLYFKAKYVAEDVESADVSFTYNVSGRSYTSNTLTIPSTFADNTSKFRKEIEDAFDQKRPINVYFNPENPQEAYLTNQISIPAIIFEAFLLIFFTVLGVAFLRTKA